MISPLQESSKSYERSADAVERVMQDHTWAMICRDIEELIEVGLGLFASYERIDSRWRSGVRRGDPAYPIEDGIELRDIACTLAESRLKVLNLLRMMEQKGYGSEGAIQFRAMAFVPFDERPLEVSFSNEDLNSLAALAAKAPETASPVDDAD